MPGELARDHDGEAGGVLVREVLQPLHRIDDRDAHRAAVLPKHVLLQEEVDGTVGVRAGDAELGAREDPQAQLQAHLGRRIEAEEGPQQIPPAQWLREPVREN